jgi:hypothetical protein
MTSGATARNEENTSGIETNSDVLHPFHAQHFNRRLSKAGLVFETSMQKMFVHVRQPFLIVLHNVFLVYCIEESLLHLLSKVLAL